MLLDVILHLLCVVGINVSLRTNLRHYCCDIKLTFSNVKGYVTFSRNLDVLRRNFANWAQTIC